MTPSFPNRRSSDLREPDRGAELLAVGFLAKVVEEDARRRLGVGRLQRDLAAALRAHRPDVGLEAVTAGGVAAVVVHGDGQEVILQVRMLDAGAAADEAAGLGVAGGAEAGPAEKTVDADQRLVPRSEGP